MEASKEKEVDVFSNLYHFIAKIFLIFLGIFMTYFIIGGIVVFSLVYGFFNLVVFLVSFVK